MIHNPHTLPTEINAPLTLHQAGIWIGSQDHELSYPEQGHDSCFQVEDSSFWFNHRNRVLTELTQQHPPQGVLFDIGGGNGYVAQALQRAGVDTCLVEPGPNGALHAHQRGVQWVVQSTLEGLQLTPDSVAAFGLFDVLEHIDDADAMLRTLFQALRPGGLLFLTLPAFSWLWSQADERAGHFRRYTTTSASLTLRRAGLETLYSTYLFSFLVPLLFFGKSLPNALGLPGRSQTTPTRDHQPPSAPVQQLLDLLLQAELRQISLRKSIPLGSSRVLVAQKPM